MVDIPLQIGDGIGNALLQGYHARALRQQTDQFDQRKALGPDVQSAIGGDAGALGRVAAVDPDYALKIGPILDRLDAGKHAVLKRAAEFTTQMGMGVLNAPPDQQAGAYAAGMAEAQRQGHDTKNWPQQWGPQAKGWVEYNVNKALPVQEYFKLRESTPTPMGGAPGGGGGGAPAPNRDQFVATMMPHALEVSRATGLDPRLVIAQSALETGWGAGAPGNNYFGVKSHGRPGGQTLGTTEVGPGGAYQTQESFRTYANPGESANDYTNFLKTNSRYGPVMAAQGLDAQIEAMGRSGYATDPNYAAKLRQIAQTIPMSGGGAPGSRPVAASREPPPGVGTAPVAQMPGPPQGLIPPGPPPAQMPNVAGPWQAPGQPQVAQGDNTPQADGSGTPLPPPAPQPRPPETMSVQEHVKKTRPGWTVMGNNRTGEMAYDKHGRVIVKGPNGEWDAIDIPKAREIPFGWAQGPDGRVAPTPGGPHDIDYQRQAAEAKRKAEAGNQPPPGPYAGNAIEAQATNIVLRGDPTTPDYAAAYAHLAAERAIADPATGNITKIKPDMSWARPPVMAGGGQPGVGPMAPSAPGAKTVTVEPGKGKPLDNSARDDLAKTSGALELVELVKSFDKSFGGYGLDQYGDAANFAKRNLPDWAGGADPKGQAQWWQRYQSLSNIERNKLFGSALTPGEAAAWKAATITPGMKSDQIETNLTRQTEIAQKAMSRLVNGMIKSGYNQEAIEAATGIRVGDLPDPIGGVPQAKSPAEKAREEFEAKRKAGAGSGSLKLPPKPGMVEDGYRFKGGDPGKQESWERVQ